jgi:hypothetical protein
VHQAVSPSIIQCVRGGQYCGRDRCQPIYWNIRRREAIHLRYRLLQPFQACYMSIDRALGAQQLTPQWSSFNAHSRPGIDRRKWHSIRDFPRLERIFGVIQSNPQTIPISPSTRILTVSLRWHSTRRGLRYIVTELSRYFFAVSDRCLLARRFWSSHH